MLQSEVKLFLSFCQTQEGFQDDVFAAAVFEESKPEGVLLLENDTF